MSEITDIQKQKRNKTRVSIFVDGEYVCGLDEVAVAAARLKVGSEITSDELKNLVMSSELNSAFERAVGYLSLSPRSRLEISQYLKNKGYDCDICEKTLRKLDEYRYIDDYAYAQSYIKSKSIKYGSFRLTSELRKKGIAPEVISELLECGDGDGAVSVAKKYLLSHRSADKQKLKRFLLGRGFSWNSIASAVCDGEIAAMLSGGEDCDDDFDWES